MSTKCQQCLISPRLFEIGPNGRYHRLLTRKDKTQFACVQNRSKCIAQCLMLITTAAAFMQLNTLSSGLFQKYFLVSKWLLSCTDLLLWKSARSLFYLHTANMSKRTLNLSHDAICNMTKLSDTEMEFSEISLGTVFRKY
jgi:hypothetical protein